MLGSDYVFQYRFAGAHLVILRVFHARETRYGATPWPRCLMRRLAGTDVWYLTLRLPRGISFVYTQRSLDVAAERQYPLLVLLDGRTYTGPVPMPTILDNLIAASRIPPVVAVFIGNTEPFTVERESMGCAWCGTNACRGTFEMYPQPAD